MFEFNIEPLLQKLRGAEFCTSPQTEPRTCKAPVAQKVAQSISLGDCAQMYLQIHWVHTAGNALATLAIQTDSYIWARAGPPRSSAVFKSLLKPQSDVLSTRVMCSEELLSRLRGNRVRRRNCGCAVNQHVLWSLAISSVRHLWWP